MRTKNVGHPWGPVQACVGVLVPTKGSKWAQHVPWQEYVFSPSRLEMGRHLLVEKCKLDRLRLEGANAAAEVLHIDESGEDRHSFHSVPIGDSRRIRCDVTDSGKWKCLIAEAWPPRERVEFALCWALYLLHRFHRG